MVTYDDISGNTSMLFRPSTLAVVSIVLILLVSGCSSSQPEQELKTSSGTLVITDVEFVDSFPPGCTIEPGCEYPIGDHRILVIWTERKDGGNLEEISDKLMEEVLPYINEKQGNLYVIASDGSQTNLERVHEQYEKSNSRFALVFAPPASANDFRLFWPGNPAISLGTGNIIRSNQNSQNEQTVMASVTPARNTARSGQAIYKEGEVINYDDISLVILGWSPFTGNDEIKPDEGNKFVMVDIVFANLGSRMLNSVHSFDMKLRDASGNKYDAETRYYYARSSPYPFDKGLVPGERMRGKILFQVPMADSGYVFVFNTTWVSLPKPGEDILVALSAQPGFVKLPAEFLIPFPGTRKIGDVITNGDLTLSVLGWESMLDEKSMFLPEDMKYVVIELVAANHGNKTLSIRNYGIGLKNITGENYDFLPLTGYNGTYMIRMPLTIAPGEHVRGKTSFKVPKEANNLISFADFYNQDPSSDSTYRVFIGLGENPLTVPAPSQFSEEQTMQIHAMGELVQMGTVLLTVTNVVFPKKTGFGEPVDGYKWVFVNITKQNTEANPSPDAFFIQGYVKDEKNQYYKSYTYYDSPDYRGKVPSGATLNQQYIYMIPKETRELLVVLEENGQVVHKEFFLLCDSSLNKCE